MKKKKKIKKTGFKKFSGNIVALTDKTKQFLKKNIPAQFNRVKSTLKKVPVKFSGVTAGLKNISKNFKGSSGGLRKIPEQLQKVIAGVKKVPHKVKRKPARPKKKPGIREKIHINRKKVYLGLAGLFLIIVIVIVVMGLITFREYRSLLVRTGNILAAQDSYETENFSNKEFNYLEISQDKDVIPGQVISFKVFFKNTGLLTAQHLQIIADIPENTELIEPALQDYEYDLGDGSIIMNIGDLPAGKSGELEIDLEVKTPLKNGTKINIPEVKLLYIKEEISIARKAFFNQDLSTEENFNVISSPDFSQSAISIENTEPQDSANGDIRMVTYGDSITYDIEVINSGNMDCEDIDVSIKNLDNLVIDPEENRDFQLSEEKASLNISGLAAGAKKSFKLITYVDSSTANDSVIIPVMEIKSGEVFSESAAPESIVKLYPAFDSSSVYITARGAGEVYSGDAVDVTVNIKNTGNIEAKNVIANLVISNLFMLEHGESSWTIEKLGVNEVATFQTSLRIVGDLTKNTYAGCSLRVSSDEKPESEVGSSSVLVSAEKPFTRNYIPIIALHGVEPSPVGRYELSTAQFDALCGTLNAMGYKTITLMDLLAYSDSGKRLPEKPVIITSDDGYQNIYSYAFPILKKYGYKMTVFLVTGVVGNSNADRQFNDFDSWRAGIPSRPMLIWPEVVAMAGYGIEFQSHGVTHRNIDSVSGSDSYLELAQSKAAIEAYTGRPCVFVAWPHGSYSGSVLSMLPEAGYRGALRYGGGIENVRSMNLYELKRVPFYHETPPSGYAEILGLN